MLSLATDAKSLGLPLYLLMHGDFVQKKKTLQKDAPILMKVEHLGYYCTAFGNTDILFGNRGMSSMVTHLKG